jgi:hypothetical protein
MVTKGRSTLGELRSRRDRPYEELWTPEVGPAAVILGSCQPWDCHSSADPAREPLPSSVSWVPSWWPGSSGPSPLPQPRPAVPISAPSPSASGSAAGTAPARPRSCVRCSRSAAPHCRAGQRQSVRWPHQ